MRNSDSGRAWTLALCCTAVACVQPLAAQTSTNASPAVTEITARPDTMGRLINSPSDSQLFAFAPKAIVDFTIRLKRATT
jgi:hypothetical protein